MGKPPKNPQLQSFQDAFRAEDNAKRAEIRNEIQKDGSLSPREIHDKVEDKLKEHKKKIEDNINHAAKLYSHKDVKK